MQIWLFKQFDLFISAYHCIVSGIILLIICDYYIVLPFRYVAALLLFYKKPFRTNFVRDNTMEIPGQIIYYRMSQQGTYGIIVRYIPWRTSISGDIYSLALESL